MKGRLEVDETSRLRQAAAQALGQLERVRPETLDVLVRTLADNDSDVQQATQETLISSLNEMNL